MPALEALVERLAAAHTLPLGVSVDSIFCHANWATSLGGISFPLLADFHPKGVMATAYGVYLEEHGNTARATVIIDADGIVRYAKSISTGERDLATLAAECEAIDQAYAGELPALGPPAGVDDELVLFVKDNCGFSRAVLLAVDNLHLRERIEIINVSVDSAAMAELERIGGSRQAPLLVVDGKPHLESVAIIGYLARRATSL